MAKKMIASMFVLSLVVLGMVLLAAKFAAGGKNLNPEDVQAIQDVLPKAYTVWRGAIRNGGDVSEFSEVFINSPEYPVANSGREFIAKVMGQQAADEAGYLTAMQAKYKAYGQAVRLLREAQAQARKEGRELTDHDFAQIREASFGISPPSNVVGPGRPPQLQFESIDIHGDYAEVLYDDGSALQKAILLKVEGKWYIADIKPINIHY